MMLYVYMYKYIDIIYIYIQIRIPITGWVTIPQIPLLKNDMTQFDASICGNILKEFWLIPVFHISLCSWWECSLLELFEGNICKKPQPFGLKTTELPAEIFPRKSIHEVEMITEDRGSFLLFQCIDRYNIAYALDNKVCQLLSKHCDGNTSRPTISTSRFLFFF